MHEQFLLAALKQAKLGQGLCAPNPCVGAVAVQKGNIIAQAWHRGAGSPHAEQLLLAQIAPGMPGVSLYITLEPCNHWGRTPPCIDAIISYGSIEEVFFAFRDPNPLVSQNDSSAILREHGIKVTHLPLKEIDEFYKSYLYWTLTGRPRVTVKMAQTLDGKIGYLNERIMLSNALCAEFTHQMRAASDIILTTARTVQVDNPKMTVRLNGEERAKPVAIIDCDLALNHDALIFSSTSHCHIYHSEHSSPESGQYPYSNCTYHDMPLKDGRICLKTLISHLGTLGFHDVWVEAGGALFSALHQEGLVHRTYLYIVPAFLGEKAVAAYQHQSLLNDKPEVSWLEMGDNMIVCLDWEI